MAIDPICGMTVDESSPLRAERDGQTYYFCSEHCRKKFVAQTRSGNSPSLATVHRQGYRFSEAMHSTVIRITVTARQM